MRNINFLVLIAVALASFANRAEAQCRVNFNSTSSVNVAGFPDSLAAGDFNRDGKLDLAIASKNLREIEYKGRTTKILLTVFSGFGKAFSVLVLTDDRSYKPQVQAFIESFVLDKPPAPYWKTIKRSVGRERITELVLKPFVFRCIVHVRTMSELCLTEARTIQSRFCEDTA